MLVGYDLDDGKGDDVVRSCREFHSKLRVIAVSAHEAGNAALLKAGAWAVCGKMEFDTIQSVIDNLPMERPESKTW